MSKDYSAFTEPILVVDDEEGIRSDVKFLVESMGLKALVAEDAQSALAFMKDNPCLIVSDYRMPGMDGVKLCVEIRKTRGDIPFLLLSGFVDKEVAIEGIQSGVTDVIEKPYDHDNLKKQILKYVDARIQYIEADAKEMDEIRLLFVEEASSLLEDLEKHILRLEEEVLDPAVVDLLFRAVHSVKGGAGAIPNGKWLAQLGHSFESCLSMIKNGQLKLDGDGMEVFLLSSDLCQKLIQLIKIKAEPSAELAKTIESCIQSLEALKTGQAKAATSSAPTAQPTAAAKADSADKKESSPENDGVWVSNEKLDSFMKLSGELIVLKNYFQVLNQEAEMRTLSTRIVTKNTDFSYSLNKITDNLQDQIMSIRKVTLERALSKLPRIFRQVTKEVNKKVKLVTEGFELGVDRTIANALSTCMTHMLRNAIDHGIEKAEVRERDNKPAEGTITITTKEQKGTIYLTIVDDGGGIDRERVISKAIEKGLIEESKRTGLTDEEAFDLIFLPGFSTAEKVTGISGRGVGMDVVKSEILNLKGKVKIESQLKVGTTFRIEVPVPKTVMVEQTVLVKSGETLIAVPLNAIAQLTSNATLITSTVGFQKTCQFQGRTVPLKSFVEISDQIMCGDETPMERKQSKSLDSSSIVILQHKTDFMGLLVDSIHDQLEAVIRPFDKVTNSFPGFKGTTVLGDDSIAYVVAPEEFVTLGLGIAKTAAA